MLIRKETRPVRVLHIVGESRYGGAAKIVARIFAESFYNGAYARSVLDPLPCEIEVEGRALAPPAWSLVCSSVVRDLGLHMLVNYRGLYAATLAPGINDHNAALAIRRLLATGRDATAEQKRAEGALIARRLLRLPWPWRFTLRHLFIATTFLAIVLGMIAWLDWPWIGK